MLTATYRGRLAPSPTGYLHLGHARTFWVAWQRARAAHGKLIFRNEDLDYQRCKPEFVQAMYEDLRWLGLDWDEGPEFSFQSGTSGQPGEIPDLSGTVGDIVSRSSSVSQGRTGRGGFGPYSQSERRSFYLDAWRKLRDTGLIYPCTCSRKDLERALSAPHEEPLHEAESNLWSAGALACVLARQFCAAGGGCGPDPLPDDEASLSRNLPRKNRNRKRLRLTRRRELALQSPRRRNDLL